MNAHDILISSYVETEKSYRKLCVQGEKILPGMLALYARRMLFKPLYQ